MIQRWLQGSISDRRQSVRHRYVQEVEILQGNEKAQGVSSDVSVHGMRVLTDKKMAPSAVVIVTPAFRLNARLIYQAPRRFTGDAEVYYCGTQFAPPLTREQAAALLAAA